VERTVVKFPYLVGESVYLRPLEKADAPVIVEWFNDAEIRSRIASWRPMSLAAEEAFIEGLAKSDDFVFAVVLKDGDRFVGNTGLHQIDQKNRSGMFGIVLGDKSAWGRGIGTEVTRLMTGWAFDHVNLNRVWLEVYDDNLRAVRVYEKVGYLHEGVLRQALWRDGEYKDVFRMAMVRADWKKIKAANRAR
jgi:RimJ/RimL family protein N-acetyltransferase